LVLTGIGTVRADDPLLTVRHVATPRPPKRAVVDGAFEIAESARLLWGAGLGADLGADPGNGEVLIFTTQPALDSQAAKAERLTARGVRIVALPETAPGRINLPALMRWLGANEINEVHVEAGAGLSGALIAADCVDELLLYQAPLLLGDGAGLARLPVQEKIDDAPRFVFGDITPIGPDLRLRARHARRWEALAAACRMIAR